MSDTQQGPGWWLASDGKWYPPQAQVQQPVYVPVATSNPIPGPAWPVLGGAALLVVGALLPWATVTAPFIGQISKNGTDGDGVLTLIAGVLIGLLGFAVVSTRETRPNVAVMVIVFSVIAGGIGVWDLIDIANRIGEAEAQSDAIAADPGMGLYLTILGAICSLVGGLMFSSHRKQNESTGIVA